MHTFFAATFVTSLKPPYYNTCADLKGGGGFSKGGGEFFERGGGEFSKGVPPLPPPCMNP